MATLTPPRTGRLALPVPATQPKHRRYLHIAAFVVAILAGAIAGASMADIGLAVTRTLIVLVVTVLAATALHRRPRSH